MTRLLDKVILVTGGSQGIGRAIAETFAAQGAKMVYAADMKPAEFTQSNIKSITMNVTNRDSIKEAIDKIMAESGAVDVLVNNAGITKDSLMGKMSEADWDIVIDVNLKGVFNVTQAVISHMQDKGKGSIINISSIVGQYGNIGQTNYAATKAGVIGLTYTWAKEFTRKGTKDVRTNAIAPGYINTDMMKTVPEEVLQGIRDKSALKRLGEPQEIANVALFLASDESSYVNGQVIGVNGGMRL
ncbi:MAG: beta-ketoacyl-ACP reductase [Alphaproteobacteria bacterium]|jgi:3-oxoacyl-[acyl-carrier protein] reductase|nr:beta-ketoacyl-ACP reductase [Alphaproteobacteria bacterium]